MKNKSTLLLSLFAIGMMLFTSCATVIKSDMGYLKGSKEFNNGKKKNLKSQIEDNLENLEKNPENWRVMNNLMVLYRKAGDLDQALKYGRDILRKDTKNYVALNNYAMIYYDKKNYKMALYYINKAMKIYDFDASIHVNLGLVLIRTKEPKLAERSFLNALKYKMNFYPAIKNLAFFYYNKREFSLAVEYLERIVKVEKNSKYKNMLAVSLNHLGKYSEAHVIYTKVLKWDRKNVVALYNSAIIDLENLEKPKIAEVKFKKVQKILASRKPAAATPPAEVKIGPDGKPLPAQPVVKPKEDVYDIALKDYINKCMSLLMLEETPQ